MINVIGAANFSERCTIKCDNHSFPRIFLLPSHLARVTARKCYMSHTPWLTCSWKSIGRIVSVPYDEHIVYRWITEHERSIVLDFQPTRSVLYSAGLPDDLHFVRTENRSPFRFADVHGPSVCILQIDFMTKKVVTKVSSYKMFKFVGEFCARPYPLKYLVNCIISYNIQILQRFTIHNGIRTFM